MKKLSILLCAILGALSLTACSSLGGPCTSPQDTQAVTESAVPTLTKDMFYKDGKFDKVAAKQAYLDMLARFGVPVSDNLRENMWVEDFGLGEFPAVGMGGIFWAQEDKYGVFGHEIYLLPNQMLIEHYHLAVPAKNLPAKYECWMARNGVSYCFGEEGEDASKFPNVKIPESQKKFVTVNKIAPACAKKGNVVWLNRIEARHFQIAGPEGAVVTEFGSFHSGEGVKFTNTNAKF